MSQRIRHKIAFAFFMFLCLAARLSYAASPANEKPFAIQIVDDESGRGVPLVELRMVNNVRFYTDSAGFVAITDPTLLGRRVFFYVTSDGYEFPKDGFGFHGVAIDLKSGGALTLKIKRLNIAERLYRVTGEGIYRDSVLLGRPVPIREPISNAQVAGQDSCQAAVYGGKIHWFWGDTSRLRYPLGQFGTAGATSLLPGAGGLDPSIGIDLSYYVGKDGFSRPMFRSDGSHAQWLDGLVVVTDDEGTQRLIGRVSRMKNLGECVSRGLVVFDDRTGTFENLVDLPLDTPLTLRGHPFMAQEGKTQYIYCGDCFPNIRVKADWASVKDPAQYGAFTCLVPGARYAKDRPQVDRDASGHLVWGWKRNTDTVGPQELAALIRRGALASDEVCFRPLDVESRRPILFHGGSVAYNAFRKKWIMIAVQLHGSSSELGEVWYSEADKPEGPWLWARKIVTHDHYSFYNPVHHPFFDQQGGGVIYFEGTYSNTFSGNDHPTPLYDYNQMMYRLDLADPRLTMPEARPVP